MALVDARSYLSATGQEHSKCQKNQYCNNQKLGLMGGTRQLSSTGSSSEVVCAGVRRIVQARFDLEVLAEPGRGRQATL
jgi:hypothetical protein